MKPFKFFFFNASIKKLVSLIHLIKKKACSFFFFLIKAGEGEKMGRRMRVVVCKQSLEKFLGQIISIPSLRGFCC
jgi:hypothetical protein